VSLSKLVVLDLSGNVSALPEPSALSALPLLQELYLRLEHIIHVKHLSYNYYTKAYFSLSVQSVLFLRPWFFVFYIAHLSLKGVCWRNQVYSMFMD
jgi:hypothetical protein